MLDDKDLFEGEIIAGIGTRVVYVGHSETCKCDSDARRRPAWEGIGALGVLSSVLRTNDEACDVLFDTQERSRRALVEHLKLVR